MPAIETAPVVVSSADLAKMEERKRPAAYDAEETAPPAKRQITSNVNGEARPHHDADIPGRDDLEKFQKEAIYRQMQEYKREKVTLEKELSDLTAKGAHHDDHIRHVDAWLWQLVDEVKLAVDKMDTKLQYSPFPTTLLSSNSEDFQEFLKSRSENISIAIKNIISSGGQADPNLADLQERIAKLVELEKEHEMEVEKHKNQLTQMEERLETASMRYMMAEKKLDRARSMTVAKLEKQAIASGRAESNSGTAVNTGKTENTETPADNESIAEAEKAKNAALAASAVQSQQLEQLESENATLRSKLTSLSTKSIGTSEDSISQTDLFKQISAQHDTAVKKANNLEALNAEIREELSKLQAERTAYQAQLDAESRAAISEKEQQLDKAERDLARIRTTRDELIADLAMRKASQEQERVSTDQIKQQVAAREDRIKALESEISRISENAGVTVNGTIQELPLEELRTKYANLERQYSMLNTELSSMSEAYKKMASANTSKVANLAELEEKVSRLGAEKSKADQKYFAAMKSKDAREQEVRSLRAQNTRSAEIISSLKEATQSRDAQIVNFEKLVSESKQARATLETKLADAQQQLEQRRLQADAVRKEMEEIIATLSKKDETVTSATNAQRKLEVQVQELKVEVDDKDKKIESWRSRGLGGENEHYEVLRSLAICTVCRRNFKDTAIKTCGHVFCKECVEDRLANRMRKCPNCNKGFGTNDYMRITM